MWRIPETWVSGCFGGHRALTVQPNLCSAAANRANKGHHLAATNMTDGRLFKAIRSMQCDLHSPMDPYWSANAAYHNLWPSAITMQLTVAGIAIDWQTRNRGTAHL